MFLQFVDSNSASNGCEEGSSGKTLYFDRKFTQIRSPDKKDPQFDYKCKHRVLVEFDHTLTDNGLAPISTGTFHNWLKQHRPFMGIVHQCQIIVTNAKNSRRNSHVVSKY